MLSILPGQNIQTRCFHSDFAPVPCPSGQLILDLPITDIQDHLKTYGGQGHMEEWGILRPGYDLIHDRDRKFCKAFKRIIDAAGVKRAPLPPRSPWLNAYAERWVKSVKDEALSRMILFGENSLRHVLSEYVEHYHAARWAAQILPP